MVAAHIMNAPSATDERRPKPSETYGANGYAARQPIFWIALSRPSYKRV